MFRSFEIGLSMLCLAVRVTIQVWLEDSGMLGGSCPHSCLVESNCEASQTDHLAGEMSFLAFQIVLSC